MYFWFVLLFVLSSLTAGYFFSIGHHLGSMSFDGFMSFLWARRKGGYEGPCEPVFEVELDPDEAHEEVG